MDARRRAGWALALALSGACATGSGDPGTVDEDAFEVPADDVPSGDDATPAEDVRINVRPDVASVDAGFDAGRDGGFEAGTDVGRDAGTDVGFDVGRDVPVGCVGATSQRCGSCGTQTRTCAGGAWSAWGACVEPTVALVGNWRLGIVPVGGGSASPSLAWFTAGTAGAVTGGAVDTYGYAELSSVVVDACAPSVTFVKRYTVGTSTGSSFRYSAPWTAGPPPSFAGNWVDVSTATNASTFTAQSRTGRSPTSFAGSWRLALDWSVTSTTFAVNASGGLTGTMVDTYGTASLQGAVDLDDGTVMFVKNYTSGSSTGQQYLYTGSVNAAGTAITAGSWSAQGTATLTGAWTAAR